MRCASDSDELRDAYRERFESRGACVLPVTSLASTP